MPIGANETLGHRIGGGVGVTEHARGEAEQPRLISPDENPERLPVATQNAGDYCDIRRAVVQ